MPVCCNVSGLNNDTHSAVFNARMEQCLVFCRTNFDCDNLEAFFNALGGGQRWAGRKESGKESPYSCVVLAGARSTDERREALQVRSSPLTGWNCCILRRAYTSWHPSPGLHQDGNGRAECNPFNLYVPNQAMARAHGSASVWCWPAGAALTSADRPSK